MTIRALLPLIALPLLLAGCATPAQRITRNLAELGVPQRQAQCMGDRLGQRLSIGQLLRLQELTSIRMERLERLERMSLRQIADKLTDEKDPGLVAEFLRAGLGCAF